MKLRFLYAFTTLALIFALSCDSSKEKTSDENKPEKEKKGSESEDEGGMVTVELEQLDGLKVDLPKGTEPGDGMSGGVMIIGMDVSVMINVAGEYDPKTLEDAEKEATETYSGKDLKSEELPDGWVLTFTNEGSLGTNYWVQSRREIGGKAYFCSTSVGHELQARGALAACKSLRK